MKVELIGVTSPGSIVLKKFPVVIGRDEEADVRLSDSAVANCQCMLDRINDELVVWDLQAGGGTCVNDAPVTKAFLTPGDRLTLGRTEFVVVFEYTRRGRLAGSRPCTLHDAISSVGAIQELSQQPSA